eukprot:CAMPEP_0198145420 /NCGR_PEP_ID=MMETSP1443-20131203/23351_1 /TAXON_ID=186043 /ORGANISM="Entomoneis sp., Strain CCMP2396" /LENGTH=161 /DNA_ID=CAMNT_0043809063 /DNA_START=53 /DNA_END=538 /DNA_ORIENTATION=-
MSSKPNRNYDPTTAELNSAIEIALNRGRTDNWKDISATLKKEHPKWKLPDRRVNKFVKRQKSGKPVGDDDESVTSSGPLRRYLSNRRISKSKIDVDSQIVEQQKEQGEKESQMPPLEKEPEEEPDLLRDITAPTPTAEAYVDENKGKKESGLCVCTGCSIM